MIGWLLAPGDRHAVGKSRRHQREARRAIGNDRGVCIARGIPPRQHDRHRHRTEHETGEKGNDEGWIGGKHEQHAIAAGHLGGEATGQGSGVSLKFGECQTVFLLQIVAEKNVSRLVGLRVGAVPEQLDERAITIDGALAFHGNTTR